MLLLLVVVVVMVVIDEDDDGAQEYIMTKGEVRKDAREKGQRADEGDPTSSCL